MIYYVLMAFAVVSALDRIFGSRLGLGTEFEKGVDMAEPVALLLCIKRSIGSFGEAKESLREAVLLYSPLCLCGCSQGAAAVNIKTKN